MRRTALLALLAMTLAAAPSEAKSVRTAATNPCSLTHGHVTVADAQAVVVKTTITVYDKRHARC